VKIYTIGTEYSTMEQGGSFGTECVRRLGAYGGRHWPFFFFRKEEAEKYLELILTDSYTEYHVVEIDLVDGIINDYPVVPEIIALRISALKRLFGKRYGIRYHGSATHAVWIEIDGDFYETFPSYASDSSPYIEYELCEGVYEQCIKELGYDWHVCRWDLEGLKDGDEIALIILRNGLRVNKEELLPKLFYERMGKSSD